MDLREKTVLVTGAASGIGLATARRMADQGARVVLLDVVDPQALASELPGQGHRAVLGDVADAEGMRNLFTELLGSGSSLAGVVNSAGIVTGGRHWPESDLGRMASVIAVNALGTAICTTLAATVPSTEDRCVVNVSSVAALRAHAPDPTYAMTKAGVLAFTRSAAASSVLRVNAVLPGVVRTAMLDATGEGGPADWIKGRLDGALLDAGQVADVIVRLFVEGHNGATWTVELDPANPTQVRIADA